MKFKILIIALIIIQLVVNINLIIKIHSQNVAISTLESRVTLIDDKLYTKADETEIDTVLSQIKGYVQKVDKMILNYKSLDEILQHMFGESQASYMGVGK